MLQKPVHRRLISGPTCLEGEGLLAHPHQIDRSASACEVLRGLAPVLRRRRVSCQIVFVRRHVAAT